MLVMVNKPPFDKIDTRLTLIYTGSSVCQNTQSHNVHVLFFRKKITSRTQSNPYPTQSILPKTLSSSVHSQAFRRKPISSTLNKSRIKKPHKISVQNSGMMSMTEQKMFWGEMQYKTLLTFCYEMIAIFP